MEHSTLAHFTEHLRGQGFVHRAIVSDEDMAIATRLFLAQDGVVDTPPEELRYIEGMLELPLGSIDRFCIVPAKGSERCRCGRTPTALDLTHTAVRRRIHDRALIRDTLLGLTNLVELAEDGRTAECIACGRQMLSSSYWTTGYMYA